MWYKSLRKWQILEEWTCTIECNHRLLFIDVYLCYNLDIDTEEEKTMKEKQLRNYFIITFAFSWILWIPQGVSSYICEPAGRRMGAL